MYSMYGYGTAEHWGQGCRKKDCNLTLIFAVAETLIDIFIAVSCKHDHQGAFQLLKSIEEETGRREDKGRHCCLWNVLECHISQLAARMNHWTSILGVGALMRCEPDDHPFSEASMLPKRVCSSIHPFLLIILVSNLLCGMELNQFRPPKVATTFAFSSVCSFFYAEKVLSWHTVQCTYCTVQYCK